MQVCCGPVSELVNTINLGLHVMSLCCRIIYASTQIYFDISTQIPLHYCNDNLKMKIVLKTAALACCN